MFWLLGLIAIVGGALLISPPVLAALWSLRARVGSSRGDVLARPPTFDERLMTAAITLALTGVVLVIVGLVRSA